MVSDLPDADRDPEGKLGAGSAMRVVPCVHVRRNRASSVQSACFLCERNLLVVNMMFATQHEKYSSVSRMVSRQPTRYHGSPRSVINKKKTDFVQARLINCASWCLLGLREPGLNVSSYGSRFRCGLRGPERWRMRMRRFSTSAGPRVLATLSKSVEIGTPPRTLISGLSLTLRQGERWALVGPNGSGKSTLSQLLADTVSADTSASAAEYVSFDSHRQLRRDEARTFRESRFGVEHKRATPASFLFPDLHPPDTDTERAALKGFQAPRTRLSPLPVPYDATGDHPLLSELERAATTGEVGRLLDRFRRVPLRATTDCLH